MVETPSLANLDDPWVALGASQTGHSRCAVEGRLASTDCGHITLRGSSTLLLTQVPQGVVVHRLGEADAKEATLISLEGARKIAAWVNALPGAA